ncbi:cytochrome c nitrite reductase small subunit [Actinomyces slackii]|uniref:Cytochrome c-type protein NrfH n=1 Tax=Actinomyces slackii TaxID=52774 RepID=A0A448K9B4_9ACTO|nr:cytochrome c nitrite reductase small subunit [Actinomyces slackii]VEG73563.1 Cytochrome c-type protein NrfH [Actinomyces slackii]
MKRWVAARWRDFTHAFTGWSGIVLASLLGVVLGVGAYTVHYSGVTGYLSDDPATCANCHAMNEQYDGWLKGSHHGVATCNDCHAPHDDIVYKYVNKADNGIWHSLKFTLQNYPENIQIREHNREITEAACLYCHGDYVDQAVNSSTHKGETMSCIRCHDGVGHKR